ncbi:MAG: uroporphyrinogen decarboxylase family protein [Armatimonadota bacterium]|nr:uroporphyrinogen decarboxylase family protein [Armatimonadota bacterium]
MTPRERVLAAFAKEDTDTVPVHHIGTCSEVASALLGREAYVGGGIQQWREVTAMWEGEEAHEEFVERSFQDAIDIALVFGNDIIRPSYWRYNRTPTEKIDENTFLFAEGPEESWMVLRFDPPSEQCHIFKYHPEAGQTFEDLEARISASEKAVEDYQPTKQRYDFELRAMELMGEEYLIRAGAGGCGIPTRNTDIWFEAMLLRPDLVGRHLDVQVERARRDIQFLSQRGFRLFWGGGDFASYEGPMYSPQVFDDLMLPRVTEIARIAEAHGGYYLFASDGNLWPVADSLFGASGVHGFYEIDRRAGMDLGRLRQEFPELTLVGNINSHTMHLGTREEVVEETLSCLQEAKRSRGIIVGVSNYFVPGTPIGNVEAMLETIKQHR